VEDEHVAKLVGHPTHAELILT